MRQASNTLAPRSIHQSADTRHDQASPTTLHTAAPDTAPPRTFQPARQSKTGGHVSDLVGRLGSLDAESVLSSKGSKNWFSASLPCAATWFASPRFRPRHPALDQPFSSWRVKLAQRLAGSRTPEPVPEGIYSSGPTKKAVDAVLSALTHPLTGTVPPRGLRTQLGHGDRVRQDPVAVRSTEELNAGEVPVLVPSPDLLAQTEAAWREGGRRGPMLGVSSLRVRTCPSPTPRT